jgi:hypothetical protein
VSAFYSVTLTVFILTGGDEGITGQNGRIKVSLRIGDDARGRRSLIELNSIPDGEDFLSVVEEIPI